MSKRTNAANGMGDADDPWAPVDLDEVDSDTDTDTDAATPEGVGMPGSLSNRPVPRGKRRVPRHPPAATITVSGEPLSRSMLRGAVIGGAAGTIARRPWHRWSWTKKLAVAVGLIVGAILVFVPADKRPDAVKTVLIVVAILAVLAVLGVGAVLLMGVMAPDTNCVNGVDTVTGHVCR